LYIGGGMKSAARSLTRLVKSPPAGISTAGITIQQAPLRRKSLDVAILRRHLVLHVDVMQTSRSRPHGQVRRHIGAPYVEMLRRGGLKLAASVASADHLIRTMPDTRNAF